MHVQTCLGVREAMKEREERGERGSRIDLVLIRELEGMGGLVCSFFLMTWFDMTSFMSLQE